MAVYLAERIGRIDGRAWVPHDLPALQSKLEAVRLVTEVRSPGNEQQSPGRIIRIGDDAPHAPRTVGPPARRDAQFSLAVEPAMRRQRHHNRHLKFLGQQIEPAERLWRLSPTAPTSRQRNRLT